MANLTSDQIYNIGKARTPDTLFGAFPLLEQLAEQHKGSRNYRPDGLDPKGYDLRRLLSKDLDRVALMQRINQYPEIFPAIVM